MPSIDVLMNARQAQREAKDVSKALDGMADSMDDFGRDTQRAGDATERSFRDMVRASERTQKAVSDDAKKGGRDLERGYREGAKDAAQGVDDGMDAMKRSTEEAGDELRQNLGETFSSFRGDLEDLPQIAQDVFGGLAGGASNLAGSLALAGGAAGIGLLIAGLQLADEEREKLEERASSLAAAYTEAGSNVLDAMAIVARSNEIINGDERDAAKAYADVLGIDLPIAARAMAGDLNALALVQNIANKATDDSRAIADAQRESLKALTPEQQRSVESNAKQIIAARELAGVVGTANEQFAATQEVLFGVIRDAGEATEEVDELGNKLITLPKGEQILIDAETGQATADISRFKGDLDGVPERVDTSVYLNPIDNVTKVLDGLSRTRRVVNVDVNVRGGGGTTWY